MATEVITFRLDVEVLKLLREAGIQPAQAAKERLEGMARAEKIKRAFADLDKIPVTPAPPGTAVRLLRELRDNE